MLGQMEKRDQTKGTHKTTINTLDSVWTQLQQTVVNCHTTSYVPFVEVYNVWVHCKVCSNVYIPFENWRMQNYILQP